MEHAASESERGHPLTDLVVQLAAELDALRQVASGIRVIALINREPASCVQGAGPCTVLLGDEFKQLTEQLPSAMMQTKPCRLATRRHVLDYMLPVIYLRASWSSSVQVTAAVNVPYPAALGRGRAAACQSLETHRSLLPNAGESASSDPDCGTMTPADPERGVSIPGRGKGIAVTESDAAIEERASGVSRPGGSPLCAHRPVSLLDQHGAPAVACRRGLVAPEGEG